MKKKFLIMFIVLCFGVASGIAQTVQEKPLPNELVLKIVYFKGRSAAYQPIPDADVKISGAWYALFQKSPSSLPAGLPVRAVNIVSKLKGEIVQVTVSVFVGERNFDKEEFVAKYSIREDEKVEIKELKKFGVEPFEISLIKITPSVANLPSIVNKTTSLEARVEANYSPLPSYKIKFLNNSNKAVSAFTFATFSGSQPGISSMPQGAEGKALIKPGDIYERTIPSQFRPAKTSDEQIADATQNETFAIKAVVFEDGTFEGEGKGAALDFLAFTFSRKLQLKQIVPILLKAGENDFKNGELSRQIQNLSIAVDETALNDFFQRFPVLTELEKPRFRRASEGLQDVKLKILGELKTFEAKQNKIEAAAMQDWIKATKEKYSNWLERLL